MEQTGWRLAESELRAWLDRLRDEGKRIVAPVDRDGLRVFRPVTSASEIDFSPGKTRWSPKEFLFPRTESLYSYSLRAEGPELHDPELPQQPQVLVGVRSCDAAGLARLDDVLKRHPENVEALTARGAGRYAVGDADGAEADLRHAIDLEPWWPEPYAGLALMYREQERDDEAAAMEAQHEKVFARDEAIRSARRDLVEGSGAETARELARLLRQAGRNAEAARFKAIAQGS